MKKFVCMTLLFSFALAPSLSGQGRNSPFAQSAQTEAVARQYFPNDIMHRSSQNINDLNIGPFTAWLMGLSDREESWYRSLLPSGRLR